MSRISCRAFLPDPVPAEKLHWLLDKARQAPSGGNLQPWLVHAVAGKTLAAIIADVEAGIDAGSRGQGAEYRIYPENLKQPYRDRRFKCGEDLYAAIGIARGDKTGRLGQFRRNFRFFGAPLALFIYIDRQMQPGQWADVGMFLQSLMLLAREVGLHTCPQEAWASWHETVARHLDPSPEVMLFCALAIGYMDHDDPINALRTDRAGVAEFTRFHDVK